MKKIMVCLGMTALALTSYGKVVDVKTAAGAAYNFYKPKGGLQGVSDLTLAYTATSTVNGATVVDFYIFNKVSGPGFVIVSGDDNVMPVLGYSTESAFSADQVNPSVQYLLNNYKNQVAYVIQNGITATDNTVDNWNYLNTGIPSARRAARTTTVAVSPMLPTKWDQENSGTGPLTYNADCPYDSHASTPGQTLTGCVATAMSQVMKYWNWPDTGVGANTYTQSPNADMIPAQTANFAIAYHFDSMHTPYVSTPNSYVAKLMYNAGVSVNMNYGTDAEGGSGAFVTSGSSPITNCAEYALKTYFRYPAERGYQRRHFTDAKWVDSMLNEMNSGRPVIYAGQGSAGGHCWVMDGYDNDSFFHFNWGWSGAYDGYFTVNNLAPPVGDTFNNDQEAIIGIVADTPAHAHDTVAVVKTGVNTLTTPAGSVLVYPNPAASTINISFDGITVKEGMVTDIEGREMMRFSPGSANSIAIPVSEWPNGLYLVKLVTSDGMLTRKFVVAK